MNDIPTDAVDNSEYASGIPDSVAELPQDTEDPELRPYVISFAKYNEKLCEIKNLDGNKGRKAVEELKKIGTKVRQLSDFTKFSVDRLPITNSGDYSRLYNKQTPDVEIYEIKLQADGRIFYFDIESERTLYVVAIMASHYETRKQRK